MKKLNLILLFLVIAATTFAKNNKPHFSEITNADGEKTYIFYYYNHHNDIDSIKTYIEVNVNNCKVRTILTKEIYQYDNKKRKIKRESWIYTPTIKCNTNDIFIKNKIDKVYTETFEYYK